MLDTELSPSLIMHYDTSQKDFFWDKEIEKKKKKKFGRIPPKNFRSPRGQARYPPPCEQTHASKLNTLAQLRCGR